jgi:hypothetical protein
MKKILFLISVSLFISAAVPKFPTLNCETLNGKKVTIPDDVKGKKSVVAIAMSAKAEKSLREWNTPLYNTLIADGMGGLMGGRMYDVNVCFVGMVHGIAKLATSEIKERTKKSVNKKLYDNFMLSEQNVSDFMNALNIKNTDEPLFFVLDPEGNIIYQTSGNYSDNKLNSITEKLIN